jgi:hypothetical protein
LKLATSPTEGGETAVYTNAGESLGVIEPAVHMVLAPLIIGSLVRIQPVLLRNTCAKPSRNKKSKIEIHLNLFGAEDIAVDIGKYLSDNRIFLQHPRYPEAGFVYKNPHILSPLFKDVLTESTFTGGIPILHKASELPLTCTNSAPSMDLFDIFTGINKSMILDEVNGDSRLRTELLRYAVG